jgi:hypothetical protein
MKNFQTLSNMNEKTTNNNRNHTWRVSFQQLKLCPQTLPAAQQQYSPLVDGIMTLEFEETTSDARKDTTSTAVAPI